MRSITGITPPKISAERRAEAREWFELKERIMAMPPEQKDEVLVLLVFAAANDELRKVIEAAVQA